jgi:hypothetical protein
LSIPDYFSIVAPARSPSPGVKPRKYNVSDRGDQMSATRSPGPKHRIEMRAFDGAMHARDKLPQLNRLFVHLTLPT